MFAVAPEVAQPNDITLPLCVTSFVNDVTLMSKTRPHIYVLFTEPPKEESPTPIESQCSPSSLPPPPATNTSTTSSPKAPEIVTEQLLFDVQEAVEEDVGSSQCLTTEQPTRVSPSSLSLLEAAADVASSLEDAVDAVIQSSPRARRRKLQLPDNDPMSVLQGGCFSGSSSGSSTWSLHRSDSSSKLYPGCESNWSLHKTVSPVFEARNNFPWSVVNTRGEKGTERCYDEERQEETWDENCRQHLADFAEKLSEKLLDEIDQYQKQTCRKPPEHSKILAGFEHLNDPYLSRLSEELQDLTKLSEELQERNSYIASLNNSTVLEEIQPSSLLIEDPINVTENRDPLLETLHYSDAAVESNCNIVDLSSYEPIEEPKPDANLVISNDSGEDISGESDVLPACNTCSRQTSDDITEDLETCVEVLNKCENGELQEGEEVEEDMPQEICDETDQLVPTAVHTAPERCDAEPSHLLRSIAGSIISLRPGYSMESSDTGDVSEQTVTSGSDCSRRDTTSAGKTESIASLGPNSTECCDAVTGNGSDCNRSLLHAGRRRKMNCDSKSHSVETSLRGISMKEATQEPPEVLTKTESCASSLSGSTSQESLPSDNGGGAITFHRYYHVFREGELDQLIERYVENLHIISSYYDHANWCVVAEKVHVWTI